MRNVRRSARHEALVRQLAEDSHPQFKRSIFPTMRELLCFAAVVGFNEGKQTPLPDETKEIDWRTFENSQQALDLIYLIALASGRDVNMLQPQSDRENQLVSIFEGFAATGLDVIERWRSEKPDDVYGDQAILTALHRHGFLGEAPVSIEKVIGDIQF